MKNLLTLKSYVLTNHNGHKLVVLKRGHHTVRLQYNPVTRVASLWAFAETQPANEGKASLPIEGKTASNAASALVRRPLTLTRVCDWKAALGWLVSLELALFDREALTALAVRHDEQATKAWPAHLGEPMHACNNALRKAG